MKDGISFNRVFESLNLNKIETVNYASIRIVKHQINVTKFSKKYGCAKDDKRYICSDRVTTYPFGYTKKCEYCDKMLNLVTHENLNIETIKTNTTIPCR